MHELTPCPVRLLLRLRWRCSRWRGCRGRSRARARQQIPDYDKRKDNCCGEDEQLVCVHRVHLLFSRRSTLAPLGTLRQAKPLGRSNKKPNVAQQLATWPSTAALTFHMAHLIFAGLL